MIAVELRTLLSLPIPRLNGRHNSSSPRSLGTHHLDIYCVTAMEAMADRFRKLLKRCRFRKFSQLHARLGRMLMSRDSLVPSDAIVSTMCLSSMNAAPGAFYGEAFPQTARDMNIEEILSAPRSPWQNAYVERLIGSIRRECLDHVLIVSDRGLRRILKSYFEYYEKSRTHLGLANDAPIPRPVQPPAMGKVIAFPEVGGLHHRYERRLLKSSCAA